MSGYTVFGFVKSQVVVFTRKHKNSYCIVPFPEATDRNFRLIDNILYIFQFLYKKSCPYVELTIR